MNAKHVVLALGFFVIGKATWAKLPPRVFEILTGKNRVAAEETSDLILRNPEQIGPGDLTRLINAAGETPFANVRTKLLQPFDSPKALTPEVSRALATVAARRDLRATVRSSFAEILASYPPTSKRDQTLVLDALDGSGDNEELAKALAWASRRVSDPNLLVRIRETGKRRSRKDPVTAFRLSSIAEIGTGDQFHALLGKDQAGRNAAKTNLRILFDPKDGEHWKQLAYQMQISQSPQLWDFAAEKLVQNKPTEAQQLDLVRVLPRGDARGRAKLADAFAKLQPTHTEVQRALARASELFQAEGDTANRARVLAALSRGLDAYERARREGAAVDAKLAQGKASKVPFPLPIQKPPAPKKEAPRKPTPAMARPTRKPSAPSVPTPPVEAISELEKQIAPPPAVPEIEAPLVDRSPPRDPEGPPVVIAPSPSAEKTEGEPSGVAIAPRSRDRSKRIRLHRYSEAELIAAEQIAPKALEENLPWDRAILATPQDFRAGSIGRRMIDALNDGAPSLRRGAIDALAKQRRFANDEAAIELLRLADRTDYALSRRAILDWFHNHPRPDSVGFRSELMGLAARYDDANPHRREFIQMLAKDAPTDRSSQEKMVETYPRILDEESQNLWKQAMSGIRDPKLLAEIARHETKHELRRQIAAPTSDEITRALQAFLGKDAYAYAHATDTLLQSTKPLSEGAEFALTIALREGDEDTRKRAAEYFDQYPPKERSRALHAQLMEVWKDSVDPVVNHAIGQSMAKMFREPLDRTTFDQPSLRQEAADLIRRDTRRKSQQPAAGTLASSNDPCRTDIRLLGDRSFDKKSGSSESKE